MTTATSTGTDTVRITREFKAPVKEVWKAWTDDATFKKWWGPEGFSCPSAELDVREGGKSVMAMKNDADGKTFWGLFTHKEVVPEKRLVYRDQFANASGKPITPEEAGMPGNWADEMIVTLTFEEKNGVTTMKVEHTGLPVDQLKDCEDGWNTSFDKLARLVEKR